MTRVLWDNIPNLHGVLATLSLQSCVVVLSSYRRITEALRLDDFTELLSQAGLRAYRQARRMVSRSGGGASNPQCLHPHQWFSHQRFQDRAGCTPRRPRKEPGAWPGTPAKSCGPHSIHPAIRCYTFSPKHAPKIKDSHLAPFFAS